jgi:hypothetical protein
MEEYNTKRLTGLARIVLMIFALFLGFLLTYNFTKPPKLSSVGYIKTMVAPSGANIKLDGKGIKAGIFKVGVGKHQVNFSKNGFASQSKTIEVVNDQTVFAGVVLQPNSQKTANWYTDHLDDKNLAQGVTGAEVQAQDSNISQNYPILSQLPFISSWYGYRIDSGSNKSGQPIIYVTATDSVARQNAITWINKSGYDPADLKVIFKNVTNPFGGAS